MPRTGDAFASGEISRDAVRVLATAREAAPEAFPEDEETLLDAAECHTFRELQHVVAYWRQAADPDGGLAEAERQWRARRLHVSHLLDGTIRVDGNLDQETGETLLSALRAVQDTEARSEDGPDTRSPAQRRADALGEVCRQWLDLAPRPTVAGDRPHVVVRVSADPSRALPGSMCEFGHTGPVHPEAARRFACDAGITRVVMGPRSQPLDVGRKTELVPVGIRRAVIERDLHCRGPGCEAPPSWCDCHHVWHWADGGPTSVENLVLLCRRHHRLVHESGLRLRMVDGSPAFGRTDEV